MKNSLGSSASINPYESPAEASATPADPLELPALGYMILGALVIVPGLGMLLYSDVLILNFGQLPPRSWRYLNSSTRDSERV